MNIDNNIEETDYDELIASPSISAEVRLMLIEKKYQLKPNLNKLKTDLYSDLLEKYYNLRGLYKQALINASEEREMKNEFKSLNNTALDLIFGLLDDPTDEVEAKSLEFLKSNRMLNHLPGIYNEVKVFALKSDNSITIEAKSKVIAAKMLNVSKRQIICLSDVHPIKK